MYPDQELNRLALHKIYLRSRISFNRRQCAEAVGHLSQPLALMDKLPALWRKISPLAQFASVPLGFLANTPLFPRTKLLGWVIRWGPLLVCAVSGIRSAFKKHRQSAQT